MQNNGEVSQLVTKVQQNYTGNKQARKRNMETTSASQQILLIFIVFNQSSFQSFSSLT